MTTSVLHTVPPGTESERIDRYVRRIFPQSSRAQIQRWIAQGSVQVNGKVVKPSHRVFPGEEILVAIPPARESPLRPEPIKLKILYEDDFLLVVDKPAGMVVHPAPGNRSGTLVHALLAHGGPLSSLAGPWKPGIVHRLDKETSGLLVVAKDDQTHRALSRQFEERQVRRRYVALVQGVISQEEGTIEAPIGRHPKRRQKMAIRYGAGREALTRYRVVKRFRDATLLELFPQTGRTHQLRVHLKHLGHPILGDTRYGVHGGFPRQALHACALSFFHPVKKRWIEVESPLPLDLQEAQNRLKDQGQNSPEALDNRMSL